MAVIAIHLAVIGYLGLPSWFAVALTVLAGLAIFYAVQELLLWQQHLHLAQRQRAHLVTSPITSPGQCDDPPVPH